jgi:hypothetical protein
VRRLLRSRLLSTLLLSAVAIISRPIASGAQRKGTNSVASACGVERWRVKIAADESRASISWTPETATVAALREIPTPAPPYPSAHRLAPYELTLYRVRAIVRQILPESDGDWHLVLADPERPTATLVAEIPDSSCALGSGHEAEYAAARRTLRGGAREAFIELDGLGFFDTEHGQRGMAPNGFELHPVIAIRLVGQPEAAGGSPMRSIPHGVEPQSQPRTDSQSALNEQVWLNTNSLVYHCANTRWYGRTRYGQFMRESDAIARGARPAYGRRCSR